MPEFEEKTQSLYAILFALQNEVEHGYTKETRTKFINQIKEYNNFINDTDEKIRKIIQDITIKITNLEKVWQPLQDSVENACALIADKNIANLLTKAVMEMHKNNSQMLKNISDMWTENVINIDIVTNMWDQQQMLDKKVNDRMSAAYIDGFYINPTFTDTLVGMQNANANLVKEICRNPLNSNVRIISSFIHATKKARNHIDAVVIENTWVDIMLQILTMIDDCDK